MDVGGADFYVEVEELGGVASVTAGEAGPALHVGAGIDVEGLDAAVEAQEVLAQEEACEGAGASGDGDGVGRKPLCDGLFEDFGHGQGVGDGAEDFVVGADDVRLAALGL